MSAPSWGFTLGVALGVEVILGLGFGDGVFMLVCHLFGGCVLLLSPVGSHLLFHTTFLNWKFMPSDSEPSALENRSVTFNCDLAFVHSSSLFDISVPLSL